MEIPQINNFLEIFLKIDPNLITIIVSFLCFFLFLFSLPVKFFGKSNFSEKLREISPALMVSAGIIGTFWGTFVALSEFRTTSEPGGSVDHDLIVQSIPHVLGGMKTAFVTSLIGLFSGFSSKFILHYMPRADPKIHPIERDTHDLLQKIKDGINGEGDDSLSSHMHSLKSEYRDGTETIKQALSGENESSIISCLNKLRNENWDNFKKLDSQMENLSDVIGNSLVEGMNNLVNKLEDVIVNQLTEQLKATNTLLREHLTEMLDRIEEALIEQFGKTFKEFNEATQAIKKWQEEHTGRVEELTAAFDMTAKSIENIRADCERIPATMEQLKTLLGELDERLRAFAEMKQQAEDSFPTIKRHLDDIGENLRESAEGFSGLQETIQKTFVGADELAQKHIDAAKRHIEEVSKSMNSASEEYVRKMRETMDNMIDTTRNSSEAVQKQIQLTGQTVQTEAERSMKEITQHLTELTEGYAEQMNKEIYKIGETWGGIMVGAVQVVESEVNNLRSQSSQRR